MANAVTACRDNAPADRTTTTTTATDANIAAAIMAYLETSASQPLPPLALARRPDYPRVCLLSGVSCRRHLKTSHQPRMQLLLRGITFQIERFLFP